jgi:hypothetical protein
VRVITHVYFVENNRDPLPPRYLRKPFERTANIDVRDTDTFVDVAKMATGWERVLIGEVEFRVKGRSTEIGKSEYGKKMLPPLQTFFSRIGLAMSSEIPTAIFSLKVKMEMQIPSMSYL